jgi:inositol transport system substrate-binding protein
VAFVGSDENMPGKLEAEEIVRLLNKKGNVAILMGEITSGPAVERTDAVERILAQYPDVKVVQKQIANWRRKEAMDLINDWLISGEKIDAVISNNDEMAIGAIMALQLAGKDPRKTLVAGVDATREALDEMQRGNPAVTVFQGAKGQGKASVDAAVKLAKGEQVERLSGSRSSWSPRRITRSSSIGDTVPAPAAARLHRRFSNSARMSILSPGLTSICRG